jgi:hypothetical protein
LAVETVVTEVREEGRVMEEAEVELEMGGVGDVEEEEVQAGGFEDGREARLGGHYLGPFSTYCSDIYASEMQPFSKTV